MKRIIAVLLATLVMLAGTTALASLRVKKANAGNFAALLEDMLAAYEAPSGDGAQRMEVDLEAIRRVSEADYAVARSIAEHWRRVYLEDYALYLHDGGERATALEAAGWQDGDIQAIVVLGYELKNGEMTGELMGRCEAAAAVARSFPSAILVCSGGATGDNNPEKHTEAGLMKAYLAERCGIDAGRIRTDERAMTTVENAVNTFLMLGEGGMETMIIVTSAYHQRWGQVIYNAVGALYARHYGRAPGIVANYCYDVEPSNERYRNDAQIAVRQLGSVLGLPREK